MQNRAITFMLLASLVASSGCRRSQPETQLATGPELHFSVLLEHSASGWAAHCDSGCSWKDVTLRCANCKVRVDADGIGPADTAMPSRGFAFVVDDSNGLSAHGERGVRWVNLSWNCATAVCRCRINEEGVHVSA